MGWEVPHENQFQIDSALRSIGPSKGWRNMYSRDVFGSSKVASFELSGAKILRMGHPPTNETNSDCWHSMVKKTNLQLVGLLDLQSQSSPNSLPFDLFGPILLCYKKKNFEAKWHKGSNPEVSQSQPRISFYSPGPGKGITKILCRKKSQKMLMISQVVVYPKGNVPNNTKRFFLRETNITNIS